MRRRQLPGEPPPPTKAELKRQARSIQALGARLIDAPDELLAALPLTEELRDAIRLARRITSHGALLRQKLYVGKLMRCMDPGPIHAALESAASTTRADAIRYQRAERWRDRLVREGQPAIDEFVAEFPAVDRAGLSRLASTAAAEQAAGKLSGARRDLFRWVRERLDTEVITGLTRPVDRLQHVPQRTGWLRKKT